MSVFAHMPEGWSFVPKGAEETPRLLTSPEAVIDAMLMKVFRLVKKALEALENTNSSNFFYQYTVAYSQLNLAKMLIEPHFGVVPDDPNSPEMEVYRQRMVLRMSVLQAFKLSTTVHPGRRYSDFLVGLAPLKSFLAGTASDYVQHLAARRGIKVLAAIPRDPVDSVTREEASG